MNNKPDGSRGYKLPYGGFVLLALIVLPLLAAPWLAGHPPAEQIDPVGGIYLPPLSRVYEIQTENRRYLTESYEEIGSRVRFVWGTKAFELRREEIIRTPDGGMARDRSFLLGTDRFGRDYRSRLLYGGLLSLGVGLAATLLGALIGLAVGAASGSLGGAADRWLMRITNGFLAFPRLFLVMALAAFLGQGVALVVLVLGGTGWMRIARLVRAEILRMEAEDYILAARAGGSGLPTILRHHFLPGALGILRAEVPLRIGDVMLIEAALAYLGQGIMPPTATWGNMIWEAAPAIREAWWASTIPGLAIVLTVLALAWISDGLRDYWIPKDLHTHRAGQA